MREKAERRPPVEKVAKNKAWGHPLDPSYVPTNKHQRRYKNRRSGGHHHRLGRPNKLCPGCHQRVWPDVKTCYPQTDPLVEDRKPTWVWWHRECLKKAASVKAINSGAVANKEVKT